MPKVRIISGLGTGAVVEMSQPEAESAIASGFAEVFTEPEPKPEPRAKPKAEPTEKKRRR